MIFTSLVAALLSVVFTGCVRTVDGNMKAGLPLTKDTVTGRYERAVGDLLTAARDVITANGVIVSNDSVNNSLIGKVDTKTIYVRVKSVDAVVSEIQVQVRTARGGGDVYLAAELEKQIALKLAAR
ncbi:MAG: hypothetical protein HZA89_08695 [Verrucomicrobia bacterium]|nr:hypothetical protein [Verrucomicrobiota bacterium]